MINKLMIFIILSTLISSCSGSQSIQRIEIKFVDVEIETPFRIECENFENFFKDEYDSVSIYDQKSFSELICEIDKLKRADLTKYSLPDTRIKISIKYHDKIAEYCLDRFVLSNQNNVFLISDSFNVIVIKYINSRKL